MTTGPPPDQLAVAEAKTCCLISSDPATRARPAEDEAGRPDEMAYIPIIKKIYGVKQSVVEEKSVKMNKTGPPKHQHEWTESENIS